MKYTDEYIARKAAFAGNPAAVARLLTEMRDSYEVKLAEANELLVKAIIVIEQAAELEAGMIAELEGERAALNSLYQKAT